MIANNPRLQKMLKTRSIFKKLPGPSRGTKATLSWKHIRTFFVIAIISVVSILVYVFFSNILRWWISIIETVLASLGVGIFFVPLWLAITTIAISKERSWLSHPRYWIAGLLLTAIAWGACAFITPSGGFPGWSSGCFQ